jgi:hypothetical protein
MGKVSGFFSRVLPESVEFDRHIKNKPLQVIYSKEKLEKVLNCFDEDDENRVLIVYIHSYKNPYNIGQYIFKKILNTPELSMFINSNFTFYPILSTSKGTSQLKQFYGQRDIPCLLFLRWNLQNKLKLLRMINLRGKPSSDEVMEAMSDSLDLAREQHLAERGILGEIEGKKRKLEQLQKEHQQKMNELLNNQSRTNQNMQRQ